MEMRTIVFICISFFIFGCGSKPETADLNTGEMTAITCVNPLSSAAPYRGSRSIQNKSQIIDLKTNARNGSKRIIRVYNEATCATLYDTDYFGVTDIYITTDPSFPRVGLYLSSGLNHLIYEVQECEDIQAKSCQRPISVDAGMMDIFVN